MSTTTIATYFVIAASGLIAGGIVLLFRAFARRRFESTYATSDEPTKWTLAWGKNLAPVKPGQRVTYTPTTYTTRLPVEAEIVDSDEKTRKLVRS